MFRVGGCWYHAGRGGLAMPVHDWTRVDAGTFPHFHTLWLSEIATALNTGVRPADYYAMAEQVATRRQTDVLPLSAVAPAARGAESPSWRPRQPSGCALGGRGRRASGARAGASPSATLPGTVSSRSSR